MASDGGGYPRPTRSMQMPAALLYSNLGDPTKGFHGYCASTPPDWSGEQARHWRGRHAEVYQPFREGLLRAEKLDDERGRGLVSGAAVASRTPLCAAQPPLSLLQYNDSRNTCEVCAYCHRFVGSLGSALRRSLETAGAGHPQDFVDDPSFLDELESDEWQLRERVPCENGCGAVFCGADCSSAANLEGWHRSLCTDLSPERRKVWPVFQRHAIRHHEQFIAAAKVMGEIISLVKYSGTDLWEAMAYFTRFAKMSWMNMLNLPSRSCTQAMPERGELAIMARAKREQRLEALTASLELLSTMLWEKQFSELMTIDFYSNLIGQFSLSNVWVQIEHPLSERLRLRSGDEKFRHRFERLVKASFAAANKAKAVEKSSSSLGKAEEEMPEEDRQPEAEGSHDESWWLPRFEGSALYPCCALSNHSCRPNFTMRYADGCLATMLALRDISEGEELNLAYVSPSYNLTERLASLWRHWGFVCTCQRCQDEIMARAVDGSGALASGMPPSEPLSSKGIRLSAAGVAAAAELVSAVTEPEVEADAEEEEEDRSSKEESESTASSEAAFGYEESGFGRSAQGPLGMRGVPASVLNLEADLKQMMAMMTEEDPD